MSESAYLTRARAIVEANQIDALHGDESPGTEGIVSYIAEALSQVRNETAAEMAQENKRLGEALRPFAALYESSKPFGIDCYADGAAWAPNFEELEDMLTVGHLRRARAALQPPAIEG